MHQEERHPDADLIDDLGGPTRVVELMEHQDKPGAVQRVSNWKRRGIPAQVRLDFPHIFSRRTTQPEPAGQGVGDE